MPSASASVFLAVSVSFWVKVPKIVTVPVGASLTLITAVVAVEATDSVVPSRSMYMAVTVMVLPTSA